LIPGSTGYSVLPTTRSAILFYILVLYTLSGPTHCSHGFYVRVGRSTACRTVDYHLPALPYCYPHMVGSILFAVWTPTLVDYVPHCLHVTFTALRDRYHLYATVDSPHVTRSAGAATALLPHFLVALPVMLPRSRCVHLCLLPFATFTFVPHSTALIPHACYIFVVPGPLHPFVPLRLFTGFRLFFRLPRLPHRLLPTDYTVDVVVTCVDSTCCTPAHCRCAPHLCTGYYG